MQRFAPWRFLLAVFFFAAFGMSAETRAADSIPYDGGESMDWNGDGEEDYVVWDGGDCVDFYQSRIVYRIEYVTECDDNGDCHDVEVRIREVHYDKESVCVSAPESTETISGDFNNDGAVESAGYNTSSGQYTLVTPQGQSSTYTVGQPGSVALPGNYTSTSCFDMTAYNRPDGTWDILSCLNGQPVSSSTATPGAVPVPADFDGDGRLDTATYDRTTGTFNARLSNGSILQRVSFGQPGDIPVPADYNGDGRADAAVYRPSTHTYLVADSSGNLSRSVQIGTYGDIPAPLYYENQTQASFAVYQPAGDTYRVMMLDGVIVTLSAVSDIEIVQPDSSFMMGRIVTPLPPETSTKPTKRARAAFPLAWISKVMSKAPGDYDRDGRTDLTVSAAGGILSSSDWYVRTGAGSYAGFNFYADGDAAVPGDFDGDGKTEPARIRVTATGDYEWIVIRPDATTSVSYHGKSGDTPLVGDFDCDGKADKAVVRSANGALNWLLKLSTAQAVVTRVFGSSSAKPFAADPDGNGCDDLVAAQAGGAAVLWSAADAVTGANLPPVSWGSPGDELMTPMDFDGDARADFVVVREAGGVKTAHILYATGAVSSSAIGAAGDIPFSGFFSGVNRAELAVYRPGQAKFVVTRFDGSVEEISFGQPTDKLVRPEGGSLFKAAGATITPGGKADKLGCNAYAPVADGAGGFTWEPGKGKLFANLYIPAAYYGMSPRTLPVLDKKGKKVHSLKFTGLADGRARFKASMDTKKLAKKAKPLVVRIPQSKSSAICIRYSSATRRYD